MGGGNRIKSSESTNLNVDLTFSRHCEGEARSNPQVIDCHDSATSAESRNDDFMPDSPQDSRESNNTFIVIQLLGSHGARYDLRYPKDFEIFTPVCENDELIKCDKSHIINAYDNSLIYTDFVVAQIIKMLQSSAVTDATLWYISDHGESLGEYNQYMHGGLPYTIAPSAQKQVPSYLWFKNPQDSRYEILQARKNGAYSQDFVFHTLLSLLEIHTKDYDKTLDMTK